MSLPKVYRDLFDNDGAGPKLKEEILPDSAASTTDLASYLPLSGGTMTGEIVQNQYLLAKRDSDDSFIEIESGSVYNHGALLRMDAYNSSYNAGGWRLETFDTSGTTYALQGASSGTLSWDGSLSVASSWTANSTSAITYGTSITKGTTPSVAQYRGIYFSPGSNPLNYANTFGAVEHGLLTTGVSMTYLFALKNEASSTTRSTLGVRVLADGTKQAWADEAFTATTLQATSDIRKKSDLKEVSPDLTSIKTYSYVLKDDGKRHVGLVAQEVEKVIPTAVTEDDEGMKSLDYNSVVAALVSEVNQLKKEIKELKGE